MTAMVLDQQKTKLWRLMMAMLVALALTAQAAPAMAKVSIDFGDKVEQVLSRLATTSPDKPVPVIVSQTDASDSTLAGSVSSAGGRFLNALPMVDGFSAIIPARAVLDLGADPRVRSLSLNRAVRFQGLSYDDSTVFSSYVKSTKAMSSAWAGGNYGDNVGVAVLDTGISDMNDFVKAGGRLIHGPDLSGEGSSVDTYGHGTVMAGIIGGDGYDSAGQPGGAFVGMAPHSWLVAVKVAGRNGVTDVSTVLAGLHWIAAYHDQYNIRVVNISWGTDGTQSYRTDPLDYAVERLWSLGITVVVAAGNSGPHASTITKPGDDPFVITVGAYDDKQNTDPADDSLAAWSSRGPTTADGISKPDVVAPGRLVIAQRSFGSKIEADFPKALKAPSYIRGSGSSEATAATSGAAALLIRQKPYLSPAQVKYAFTSTASPMASYDANSQGAGRIDVAAALASADEGSANAATPPSSGLGSLEGSRGTGHVQINCNGSTIAIQGEFTAQCSPVAWNGGTWTGGTWTGDAWTGGTWTGGTWTGGTWTGGTWTGGTWTGGTWTGGTWTGGTWTGGTWTGGTWTGGTWTAGTWTGGTWTGGTWTGGTWTGGTWTGGTWTGGTWTGGTWTSGTYDGFTGATYDEFLTAFWGNHPRADKHLHGETSDPLSQSMTRN
ncbi:MAG: S8 family serine peptidase [Actinomycetota bacterium]|nr:S8 family serine peptidase [Actinomycetota bacterium]